VRLITYGLATSKREVGLTCCCKIFEDPVLDATWETQRGLAPLPGAFPQDVWEMDCTVSTRTIRIIHPLIYFIRKVFKRPPTTLELASFRRYSRRVRKLWTPSYVSSGVFLGLQRLSYNEPLLPNLTLYLWQVTAEFTRNIFSTLRCPNLQQIHFQRTPRDPAIIAGVSEFVLTAN
jgi:hypothetical protein